MNRLTLEDLCGPSNALVPHYKHFRVDERVLLSGHSHQAWPDKGLEGLQLAWEDAAHHVDDKWSRAFAQADQVRSGYARLMGDSSGYYSLAAATHDLLIKLLSSLPLGPASQVVTTDAEFHAMSRQLLRLEEEGVEVVRVASEPAASVGQRLADAVCEKTAFVFTSTVYFRSAKLVGDLTPAAVACRKFGIPLILDTYHQLNAVPFSLDDRGLEDAFAVGGGYKYCQLGEGNGFLRFPRDCQLRPVYTGWFAEFGQLSGERTGKVAYNSEHDRFAGATYDPVSNYRGAAVFSFFDDMGLNANLLRQVNQRQMGHLMEGFDALDINHHLIDRDRSVSLEEVGGFLALRSPVAGEFHKELKARNVMTDFRADILRLGPAPYVSDAQLDEALAALGECAKALETTL